MYVYAYIYIYIYMSTCMNTPQHNQGYLNIDIYVHIGESLKIISTKSGKCQIKGYNPPLEIANMLLSSRLKEFYMKEINEKKSTKLKEMFNINQVYIRIYILIIWYIHMYICMNVYRYIHIYVYVYTYIYIYIYTFINI
jgi:hypothetical protein